MHVVQVLIMGTPQFDNRILDMEQARYSR